MRKSDFYYLVLTAISVSLFSFSLLSGCAPKFQWPAELKIDEARRRAESDVASGNPMIMKIGAANCWEPGVSYLDKDTVRLLPRETSRCGKIEGNSSPDLRELEKYAYAYNKQIIELLKAKR